MVGDIDKMCGQIASHFGNAPTLGPYLIGKVALNRHKALGELEWWGDL
jgi:hypothetical protein